MDGQTKVAVIYYSATGITYQMAQAACEAAGDTGVEVRLRKVRELWARGALANKVYTGFTSTATSHGGQESTLLSMYTIFYHWGGIVVTPGYTDPSQFTAGNPYGASHTSNNGETAPDDIALKATGLTARRAIEIGSALKRGIAVASSPTPGRPSRVWPGPP